MSQFATDALLDMWSYQIPVTQKNTEKLLKIAEELQAEHLAILINQRKIKKQLKKLLETKDKP